MASVVKEDRLSLLIAVSAAQAWLLEDANICLLNEWSLPSMSFGNQRNHSVIGVIWSDFLEELSCLFHFSLSVLPLGGREKFCLDTYGSTHVEFPVQEWERVSVLTKMWEVEEWRCCQKTPAQTAVKADVEGEASLAFGS